MRHLLGFVMSACALSLTSFAAQSPATPRDGLLVSPAWLSEHISDPDLVVLHVGLQKSYAAAHIPGAQFISQDTVSAPFVRGGLMTEVAEPTELLTTLRRYGISDRSKIVVYNSDDYFAASTRVIYALGWAGLGAQTVMLDGGLAAWTGAGRQTTTAVPTVVGGTLSPLRPRSTMIVDAAFVRANRNTPGVAIIDGRTRSAFDGVPSTATEPRGHIPGARSVPYSEILGADGTIRQADELRALFSKAGVAPGDTIVGYCWVGMQATAMLFAARTLGHEVRLYDGSIEDWNRRQLPLEAAGASRGSRAADQARDGLIVSPSWLATHLNDSGLVLLHVGVGTSYAAGHIPGAQPAKGWRVKPSETDGFNEMGANDLTLELLPSADVYDGSAEDWAAKKLPFVK